MNLVSVITPSYNQADFIEDTILSVKHQDYPYIEHLVLDGGSTDGTVEILEHYGDHLTWVSEPDEGQSDAINKGFRRAQGEIIGSWLNSDDTYWSGAVSTAVTYLQEHPDVGWVYGDGYIIDEHNRILRKSAGEPFDLKRLICEYQYIFQPSVFFRREVLERIGFVDAGLHMTMDYDFFIRMGLHFKGAYIPQVLATRRFHSEAKTSARSVEFCADGLATLDKVFALPDLPADIRPFKKLAYSNRHASCAYRCFYHGQYQAARQHLIEALRLHPNLFSRRNAITLFVLLQSLLGIQLYQPDERRQHKFQATHSVMPADWFRQ